MKAIVHIPASATKPEGKYIDLGALRSMESIFHYMGFEHISLKDLIDLAMKQDKKLDK